MCSWSVCLSHVYIPNAAVRVVRAQVNLRVSSSPAANWQQTKLQVRLEPQQRRIVSKNPESESRTVRVTNRYTCHSQL